MICAFDRYLDQFKTVDSGHNYKIYVHSHLVTGAVAYIDACGTSYCGINSIHLDVDHIPVLHYKTVCPRCGSQYSGFDTSNIDLGWAWTKYECGTMISMTGPKLLGIIVSDSCSLAANLTATNDDAI